MASYRIPGPYLDVPDFSSLDDGTSARWFSPLPGGMCSLSAPVPVQAAAVVALDADVRALAAVAYGEGSTANVFEEMAAIANVLVRQQKARGYATMSAFIAADKTFAFAAHDGNARHDKLKGASDADIAADTAGMAVAVRAARNALSVSATDYAKGGYFWDGADIKSNYAKHAKVLAGIHFSDIAHNIYSIAEKDVAGEEWWRSATGQKTKLRGTWKYKYESTAAYGGTIFWRLSPEFIKASGNKEYN